MTSELRLLDEVAWRGATVAGGRIHALLAALVIADGGALSKDRLVEEVWGQDNVPANPAKALQVVVSRARSQTAAEVVQRTDHGYRLGLRPHRVDALVLHHTVARACEAEGRLDAVQARNLAQEALALPESGSETAGPLGELRARAFRERRVAVGVLGRALSALGDHDEALRRLSQAGLKDDGSTVARLRSIAAVQGAAVGLEEYERHRADLAERLGVDPGPSLQELHVELLIADRPVRSGLRFDATNLIGRDDDIRALRAAVREARVTSILGTGGLGKTRLAQLLGREADQPIVHFVEFAGVASPEDVVGSALGVRDSVSGRRALSAEQLSDVRARIGQKLDRAPTLLILDNCEHVVAAVADLVAFLVSTCRRLRVVTTTRAPLAIAAERIFPLGRLSEDAAAELFQQRASDARPGLAIDDEAVRRVVRRLDGLPLAIELAAAKVRGLAVGDIDLRLDNRFALLRGGDRSAPDRPRPYSRSSTGHGTCLARGTAGRCAGFRSSTTDSRSRLPAVCLVTTCSRRSNRWSISRCLPCSMGLARCGIGCWRRSASSAKCSWSAPVKTAGPRRPSSPGPGSTSPAPVPNSGQPARSRRCTSCGRRITIWPTASARQSPVATRGPPRSCWPFSAITGPSPERTPGSSRWPRPSRTSSRAGSRRSTR